MILNKENCKQIGGLDLIEHNDICFPMAWQSGVSFDSGILISWDPDKKSQWVQEMPTREELHGFDCISFENRLQASLEIEYSENEKFKYYCERNNIKIVETKYSENIIQKIELNEEEYNSLNNKFVMAKVTELDDKGNIASISDEAPYGIKIDDKVLLNGEIYSDEDIYIGILIDSKNTENAKQALLYMIEK